MHKDLTVRMLIPTSFINAYNYIPILMSYEKDDDIYFPNFIFLSVKYLFIYIIIYNVNIFL